MNAIVLDLPSALRDAVAEEATRRGVSEATWLEEAVRDKLAVKAQRTYLADRAARADRAAYEQVLAKVPAEPPQPGDERP